MSVLSRPDLGVVTIATDDLDEIAELTEIVLSPLALSTEPGGSVTRIGCGDIEVGRGHLNQLVHSHTGFPDDVYTVGLKLATPLGH